MSCAQQESTDTPGSSLFPELRPDSTSLPNVSYTSQTEHGQNQFILPTPSSRQHTAPSLSYLRRWPLKAITMTPAPFPLCLPHNWLPRNVISSILRPLPPSTDSNFLLLLGSPSWLTILAATAPTTCTDSQGSRSQPPPLAPFHSSQCQRLNINSPKDLLAQLGTAEWHLFHRVLFAECYTHSSPGAAGSSPSSVHYLRGWGWRVVSTSLQVRFRSPELSCSGRQPSPVLHRSAHTHTGLSRPAKTLLNWTCCEFILF